MFQTNSNQETIPTMWFDPYCPHKGFITFHQRLMQFSISNAFKKLNWRQQNLIHVVLNIMLVFQSALHFPMFPTKFDQSTIWFDPCYVLKECSGQYSVLI